jgi:4-amino-4-deoxy-L-arabinose transferase-like glycosyltransferase
MLSLLTTSATPWILLLAGALLRLWMIHLHPQIQGDALLYGDIAANWLQHGVFGHSVGHPSGPPTVEPTLVRLPGYPAFLALCFAVFGVGKYKAAVYLQALIDLGTCWLAAGLAAKIGGRRAGLLALTLGVLCPFTAVYAAFPLSETLTLFCFALGFRALPEVLERPRSAWVLAMVFSWSYAALLRPDGAMLAVVLWVAWIWYGRSGGISGWKLPMAAALLSVLPFIPWTLRNWRTFHVFEPLAPRYANDPGEFAAPGFIRWVRTFTVDFTTTSEVYWTGNSDRIDIHWLPARAFDNHAQYEETRKLLDDYNQDTTLTPELDVRFEQLAQERITAHPFRYYVLLPLARLGNMWFRPRLETGDGDLRWWQYNKHPGQTLFAFANAGLNLVYVVLGVLGILRWPRFAGAMLAMIVMRCLLLATIEAPETRYTLECFPLLFVLGGCYLTTVCTSLGNFNSNTEGATGLL